MVLRARMATFVCDQTQVYDVFFLSPPAWIVVRVPRRIRRITGSIRFQPVRFIYGAHVFGETCSRVCRRTTSWIPRRIVSRFGAEDSCILKHSYFDWGKPYNNCKIENTHNTRILNWCCLSSSQSSPVVFVRSCTETISDAPSPKANHHSTPRTTTWPMLQ